MIAPAASTRSFARATYSGGRRRTRRRERRGGARRAAASETRRDEGDAREGRRRARVAAAREATADRAAGAKRGGRGVDARRGVEHGARATERVDEPSATGAPRACEAEGRRGRRAVALSTRPEYFFQLLPPTLVAMMKSAARADDAIIIIGSRRGRARTHRSRSGPPGTPRASSLDLDLVSTSRLLSRETPRALVGSAAPPRAVPEISTSGQAPRPRRDGHQQARQGAARDPVRHQVRRDGDGARR